MKANLPTRILIGFLLAGINHVVIADPPTAIVEKAGGFAYTVPKGWTIREMPGLKYRIAYTAPSGAFVPNLNVIDRDAPGTVADCAKISVDAYKDPTSDMKLIRATDFVTNSKLKGIRLLMEEHQKNRTLRHISYLFPGAGDHKYLVTFTALGSDHDKWDAAIDASLRTFKLL